MVWCTPSSCVTRCFLGSLDFVDMKRAADVVMTAACCCCWACCLELREGAAAERAAMALHAAE